MPWKYADDGALVTQEVGGKHVPVFVNEKDGKEAPFDADSAVTSIGRLNGEAMGHRRRAEEAEARSKMFEGIDDPEAARSAIATVANLSAGELKTAAQVKEITDAANRTAQEAVANATRAAEAREREKDEKLNSMTGRLNDRILGAAFGDSKFIRENIAIPPAMVKKLYGDRFKVENDKIVALDAEGHPIYSATKHGEPADFEEAIGTIIGSDPGRDNILKGSGASGSGAQNGGLGSAGGKTIRRSAYNALPPGEQRTIATEGKVKIID